MVFVAHDDFDREDLIGKIVSYTLIIMRIMATKAHVSFQIQ